MLDLVASRGDDINLVLIEHFIPTPSKHSTTNHYLTHFRLLSYSDCYLSCLLSLRRLQTSSSTWQPFARCWSLINRPFAAIWPPFPQSCVASRACFIVFAKRLVAFAKRIDTYWSIFAMHAKILKRNLSLISCCFSSLSINSKIWLRITSVLMINQTLSQTHLSKLRRRQKIAHPNAANARKNNWMCFIRPWSDHLNCWSHIVILVSVRCRICPSSIYNYFLLLYIRDVMIESFFCTAVSK